MNGSAFTPFRLCLLDIVQFLHERCDQPFASERNCIQVGVQLWPSPTLMSFTQRSIYAEHAALQSRSADRPYPPRYIFTDQALSTATLLALAVVRSPLFGEAQEYAGLLERQANEGPRMIPAGAEDNTSEGSRPPSPSPASSESGYYSSHYIPYPPRHVDLTPPILNPRYENVTPPPARYEDISPPPMDQRELRSTPLTFPPELREQFVDEHTEVASSPPPRSSPRVPHSSPVDSPRPTVTPPSQPRPTATPSSQDTSQPPQLPYPVAIRPTLPGVAFRDTPWSVIESGRPRMAVLPTPRFSPVRNVRITRTGANQGQYRATFVDNVKN